MNDVARGMAFAHALILTDAQQDRNRRASPNHRAYPRDLLQLGKVAPRRNVLGDKPTRSLPRGFVPLPHTGVRRG